jgi:hypothetical protein
LGLFPQQWTCQRYCYDHCRYWLIDWFFLTGVIHKSIFTWNSEKKGALIVISSNLLTATRTSKEGKNPSIITNEPLTRNRPAFRVKVDTLGTWIGIGKWTR